MRQTFLDRVSLVWVEYYHFAEKIEGNRVSFRK
jgi:hypothetical protein